MVNCVGTTFGFAGHLKKLCRENRLGEALAVVELMDQRGMHVSRDTLYCLLQECSKKKVDLITVRRVQSLMISNGFDSVPVLADHLIRLFASCGSLVEATDVFLNVSKPSVYTWSAILSANVRLGESGKALELYQGMQHDGLTPDNFIFSCILKACGSRGIISPGRLIHEQIIRSGFNIDIILGNSLLDMYAKCGSLEEARMVFDGLMYRDLVSWAVMISVYAQYGHSFPCLKLFKALQHDGLKPDKFIFSGILKACANIEAIEQGRLVHDQIVRSGIKEQVIVWSALVDMYAKCGSLQDAHVVFTQLPNRDVVSWGSIILGFAQYGYNLVALEHFEKLQQEGIKPDNIILSCILGVCGSIGSIREGRLIHDQITKDGPEANVIIESAIVDMYCKCCSVQEAQKVFDKILNRDVVSWGAMIGGCAQCGYSFSALNLFDRMQQEGIEPCKVTLTCTVKACSTKGAIQPGRLIHEKIVRSGLESDMAIGSTVVDMYAKCGSLDEACKVFDGLPDRDIVSWGVMMAGYTQHQKDISTLKLFENMLQQMFNPGKSTFLHALKACSTMGAIRQGRLIHDQIIKISLETYAFGNALVDMYAKCGSLEEACKVFNGLHSQDVVSWGAIIGGSAHCGNFSLAKQCLEDMQQLGLEPNDVIFISILTACSHSGLLELGRWYFTCMREDHGVVPNIEHYSCMVDLLGRAGHFSDVEDLLQTMPASPNLIMWTSLLSSCRSYGNMELARRCFNECVQSSPNDASGYVLMSKMCAAAQMWEDVDEIQGLKQCAGAWKEPGRAWIQADQNMHEFLVGDKYHPESDEMCFTLKRVFRVVKEEGYVPQFELLTEPMPDECVKDIVYYGAYG